MSRSRLKWAVALGASVLIHAGAAAFFAAPEDEIQIQGGQQSSVIVLGDAFEDMASVGEPVETVETVETIQPETAPVEPVKAETVVPERAPIAPTEAAAERAEPVAPESTAAVAVEAEPVEPTETGDVVAALAPIPVPTPRPADMPSAPKKVQETKPSQEPNKPRQSGSGGANQRDAKRGASDSGASSADGAAARSESRPASAAGSAAVSNYPGKIVSRLRRSLRYPSEAKRNRITGEAHVRFVVSANGAAQSVKIVRSSGSPILDRAALETVRRAAPFPAIPREAGRSSWPFTVPLAFTR